MVPFLVLLSLPFIYIPGDEESTKSLRAFALIALPAIMIAIDSTRQELWASIVSLPKLAKAGLTVALILAVLSTLTSFESIGSKLVGTFPGYIGLSQWLTMVLLAIYFRTHITKLVFNRAAVVVLTVIVVLSLLIDTLDFTEGFRMDGLLLQSTSMGVLALVSAIISLYKLSFQDTSRPWIFIISFLLSCVAISLTQSKIAIIGLFLLCLLSLIRFSNTRLRLATLSLLSLSVVATLLMPNLFSRYSSELVGESIAYRAGIYATSLKEVASENIILGSGASTLPSRINDPSQVPDDIARSLGLGFQFASAHDLIIDVALLFGGIAAIILVLFCMTWIVRPIDWKAPIVFWYVSLFVTVLCGAIVNVPTIELTPLFFTLLAGLYALPLRRTARA